MKKIPYHLGIIIDGNRRWARKRGLPIFEGHRQGLKKAKKFIKWCKSKNIKVLTLYCFSTENWNRSKNEVNYLMRLLKLALTRDIKQIHKNGIKVQIIGQKQRLPKSLQKAIKEAKELTRNNKKGILNLAISYGGRTEVVEVVNKILKLRKEQITEEQISRNLWTADTPDPDLIIRTGGEQRLSNFLIWQTAYSELYFCKKYWPDFSEKDLDQTLADYASRQRRFGA